MPQTVPDVKMLKEIKDNLAKLYSMLKNIDLKIQKCCGCKSIPVVESKKVD